MLGRDAVLVKRIIRQRNVGRKYNYTSTGTEGDAQVMKHMLLGGRKNWQEVGLEGRQEAFREEPFMPC